MEATYAKLIAQLPDTLEVDLAVESACENAAERGLDEGDDPEAFWQAVYDEVVAAIA